MCVPLSESADLSGILDRLTANPNAEPVSKFQLQFKKALSTKGRPRKRSKQIAIFNKTRLDRKENDDKKKQSSSSRKVPKRRRKNPTEVMRTIQATNDDDGEFSGSELLQDVIPFDQSPPNQISTSHVANAYHDRALILPQSARYPANSTHQTEYLHHNDSALTLPQTPAYPLNLNQQTKYVQHDSLMMPHPARLSVNLTHHHGSAELDNVTNIDMDMESPQHNARTFTSL